jgi:hypothetical protein
MRYKVLTTLASCAMLSVGVFGITAPTASATPFANISGELQSSSTLSAEGAIVSFCPSAGDVECTTLTVPSDGRFTASIVPDEYDVYVRSNNRYRWSLSTRVTITDPATWQLQLPELVRVTVIAKDADGDPLPRTRVIPEYDQPADDVRLTTDLPAFSAHHYFPGSTTDAEGRAVLRTLPDADLQLDVFNYSDGATSSEGLEYQVPLKTASQTSVDASSSTRVVAKAPPLHTVTLRLRDHEGRAVTGYTEIQGEWGISRTTLPETGPATLLVAEGSGQLTITRDSAVWYLPSNWQVGQPLEVASDRVLTLTLPDTVKVTTTVIDRDTDLPASGVRVDAGGPADNAVLAPGLAPAQLSSDVVGKTKPHGAVVFRVFPDESFTVAGTLQSPGVYRESSPKDYDAQTETAVTHLLPRSRALTVEVTDDDDAPVDGVTAQLRAGYEYTVPFLVNADGDLQMRLSQGTAQVETYITNLGYLEKTVEVVGDTPLRYQLPPLHEVTLIGLDSAGRTLTDDAFFFVSGPTTVKVNGEPTTFGIQRYARSESRGTAVVSLPESEKADIELWSGGSASVLNVPLTGPRVLALQDGVDRVGGGMPYVHLPFDTAPTTLTAGTTTRYALADADQATFEQRVIDVKGDDSGWTPFTGSLDQDAQTVQLAHHAGATTCLRARANVTGVSPGPYSAPLCRTRPVDDRHFDARGTWRQVDHPEASGGSFQVTKEQGASLRLDDVRVRTGWLPGPVELVVLTSDDAGSIRLRADGGWISNAISLADPAQPGIAAAPSLVEVPLTTGGAAIRGPVDIVVLSRNKPVRIDGLALPSSLGAGTTFPGY